MKGHAEILIVENSSTQALRLQRTLEQKGFGVRAARDGAEALALLEQAEPALIITAVEMPGMGGYQLCQKVKSDERFAEIPVMLLTSLSNPEDVIKGLECGADNFLTKPYEAESLLSRIDSILANKELREKLPAPAGPLEQRKLHILLAEDSRVNQLVTTKMLKKNGHSVVVAENGVEALAALAKEPFDLILMDVEMPEMDGLEATALIREKERETGGRIRILAMTAHTLKGDLERCIQAGMDAQLSKPFKLREFFQTLDEVARRCC